MMKPIFGKEDFTKKVKRIENLNSQTTKSSTNQRIITISPNRDRDNKCKKSNEHYNNIQNMHNPIKKTHTKKSSISPLLIENPINLNNYLNDKKSVKTTSTEKLKKNNNSGGVNSTFSTFVNKVSKNKRQNTEAFGLFVNNLNYNPESRHDVVYKKEQGKSKVINNQKQYETNTHDKNVLIDSIDDVIDTDMLGKINNNIFRRI